MRRINLFFLVVILGSLLLVGCNKDKEETEEITSTNNTATDVIYEPESINSETDICEICAMAIGDDQHATQIILKNKRSLKFDDLGCLYEWIEKNGEDDIGAKFVRDFYTKEWILLEEAIFVFDEGIETPMAYGIISFKERTEAEKYIKENEIGELLKKSDLKVHKWEMMNHDHSHDHDHGLDTGHEHSEHGFHTEGFEMEWTELEDVKVLETNELNVSIFLNEKPLEKARVRYEIWKADNEDQTDWVLAQENQGGLYASEYEFAESGIYHIQIHVEDDKELHEHMEVEVIVKE